MEAGAELDNRVTPLLWISSWDITCEYVVCCPNHRAFFLQLSTLLPAFGDHIKQGYGIVIIHKTGTGLTAASVCNLHISHYSLITKLNLTVSLSWFHQSTIQQSQIGSSTPVRHTYVFLSKTFRYLPVDYSNYTHLTL